MVLNYSKVVLSSDTPAFKNNRVYTGTLTLNGSVSDGTNIRTFTIALDQVPDMLDIVLNGPPNTSGNDPRPSSGWFKIGNGSIGTVYSGTSTVGWNISYSISGKTLTLTAMVSQQFSGTYTITPTNFSYRIVDYSVAKLS